MLCGKRYPFSKQIKCVLFIHRYTKTLCALQTWISTSMRTYILHTQTVFTTSCHLVLAGSKRLKETEAIDSNQSSRIEDTQLLVLWEDQSIFTQWCYFNTVSWQEWLVFVLPALLPQDDEGSHMCGTWASVQGPHAEVAPEAEPHAEKTQVVTIQVKKMRAYNSSVDVPLCRTGHSQRWSLQPHMSSLAAQWSSYTVKEDVIRFIYVHINTPQQWTLTFSGWPKVYKWRY